MNRLARTAVMSIVASSAAHFAEANTFNLTKPYHNIEVGVDGGEDFTLGRGVDVRDPSERVFAPRTPFEVKTLDDNLVSIQNFTPPQLPSAQNAAFTYIETADEKEEARYLYAYFRISYLLASLNAATERVKNDNRKSQSIYMFAKKEGGTRFLKGGPDWKSTPESEGIDDINTRAAQFIAEYGSHYISQITYGYTIVIRATINSTEVSEKNAFSAKLKAGIGKLSGGGSLTTEEKDYFRQGSINIVANVLSGGTEPQRNLVMTSMDDIAVFLTDWKKGDFYIKDAPVRAVLTSWWAFLSPFPKTREALSPFREASIKAPFGVPQGTVVAWVPTPAMIDSRDPENPIISYPEGWRLCDGEQSTAKIGSSFLYGTSRVAELGSTGGNTDHSHVISIGIPTAFEENLDRSRNTRAAKDSHTHAATASVESNLPPFYRVLWICRQ